MVFLTGIRLKTMKNGKNKKKENRRKDTPLGGKDKDKRVAQTANKRMAVPLRSTQILLRFTAQNFAMRQPLAEIFRRKDRRKEPRARGNQKS